MTPFHGTLVLAQDQGALPSAPSVAKGAQSAADTSTGTTGAPGSPNPQAAPQSPFGNGFLLIAFGMLGVMLVMSTLAGRKEKKRVAEMLAAVKRHDRVLMTGGMIGTIADVREDEVVVKVDDATNTRIHFRRSAIQQVLRASSETAAAESSAA